MRCASDVVRCQGEGDFLVFLVINCFSFKVLLVDAGSRWGPHGATQSRAPRVTAALFYHEPTEIYSTETPISRAGENVELNSKNKMSCI